MKQATDGIIVSREKNGHVILYTLALVLGSWKDLTFSSGDQKSISSTLVIFFLGGSF